MGRTRNLTSVRKEMVRTSATGGSSTSVVVTSRKRRILDSTITTTSTISKSTVIVKDNFKNRQSQNNASVQSKSKIKAKTKTNAKVVKDGMIAQTNGHANGYIDSQTQRGQLRSSSRSRLQSIPYQSPESILKISSVFTKTPSQSISIPTIDSLKTTTTKTTAKTSSSKAQDSISSPSPIKQKSQVKNSKTVLAVSTAKGKSKNNKNGKNQAEVKNPLKSPAKKSGKISKSKTIVKSIQQKVKKQKAAGGKSVAVKKAQVTLKKLKAKKTKTAAAAVASNSASAPRRKRKIKEEDEDDTENDEVQDSVQTQGQDKAEKPKKKRVSKKLKASDSDTPVKKIKETKPKKSSKRGAALNPKPELTAYDQDPTFWSKETIPAISTLSDSRLLFRAINLKDNALLKSILKKKSSICTLAPSRCFSIRLTPLIYALRTENVEAIKLLTEAKADEGLGSVPELLLSERNSSGGGYRNRMMFGHALKDVTVGRGGKEGNHAFSYDEGDYTSYPITKSSISDLNYEAHMFGIKYETLEKISALEEPAPYCHSFLVSLIDSVIYSIRYGHRELAGRIIQDAIKRQGYGFNQLHLEVLTHAKPETLTPFKSVSVVKKAQGNFRITPLHCAAINPNPAILQALLNSKPELQIVDADNWTILHYAAVCKGSGPLDFLLQRGGIALTSANKEGNTPLHLACALGRVTNAQLLIEREIRKMNGEEKEEEDEEEEEEKEEVVKVSKAKADSLALSKFSGTSLIMANKQALTPMHVAAFHGHVEVLKLLLKIPGIDVNKNIPAQQDKLTPLMIACQRGCFEVVKYLAEERETLGLKFEIVDRRGRTALAHAVMNGHADIVSYLLRLGVNHLTKDSSGNTLAHYAAAYGWYFNLKLLLEAGCPLEVGNQWKMTPLAIAFMKGHIGIVQFLMNKPGMNINSPVNDTTGVTLLLEACQSKPSKNFYDRIVFLLDEMGADCNVTDFQKENCLHKLVKNESKLLQAVWFKQANGTTEKYHGSEEQQYLFKAVKLLMDRGCSPTALDYDQVSPISAALKNTACFDLLCQIFEIHPTSIPLVPDKSGDNLLHILTPYVTFNSFDKFLQKLLQTPENLNHLRAFAQQVNASGYTPLLLFIQRFPSSITEVKAENDLKNFLSLLIHKLNSDITAVVQNKARFSAIHLAAECALPHVINELLLHKEINSNLEILNAEQKTPLMIAIMSKRTQAVLALIEAGANVNIAIKSSDLNGNPYNTSLLVHICEKPFEGTFNLVPLLISKGALVTDVDPKTGNSPLHFIASLPNHKGALESIEIIIAKGLKADAVNKSGRTALHLVVNSRGGETDVSYDIEDILIEKGPASLAIRDKLGRLPLHYAFTKIDKSEDASFMDPIELVGILVQGMKDNGFREDVKCLDQFGKMPLHYAAIRGATISSSFLVTETSGKLIDLDDLHGNTPFGLAVLHNHEGCALAFQQLNGNFTLSLNTSPNKGKSYGTRSTPSSSSQFEWEQLKRWKQETAKKEAKKQMSTVLEQVVSKDWQGILHLMLETLKNTGASVTPGIHAAIKTLRLKLALKLIGRIKNGAEELKSETRGEGTLLHLLAKYRIFASLPNRDDVGLKIFSSLVAKGVDIFAVDRLKSTALIHAAKVRDEEMCDRIWKQMDRKAMAATSSGNNYKKLMSSSDVFGRNSFSALFWNLGKNVMSNEMQKWAREHCEDFNALCRYPVRLTSYPGVRYFRLGLDEDEDENEEGEDKGQHLLTPLMVAILYSNYSVVKWLLGCKSKIDVNFPDGQGRTAIMHAVRLNDIKMVKLLLNPTSYKPAEDNIPWDPKSWFVAQNNHGIDLTRKDNKGLGVIDHLITPTSATSKSSSSFSFSYLNARQILKILHKANRNLLTPDTLQRAIRQNQQHLVQYIQELQGVPPSKQLRVAQEFPDLVKIKEGAPKNPPNFIDDAQSMASIIIEEAELKEMELEREKNKHVIQDQDQGQDQDTDQNDGQVESSNTNTIPKPKFVLIPDPLITNAKDYEVAIENDQPFDVILTKVDINYGMFGLYNFYKMQLLREPKGKGMILLFTRWGRIGDEGQFQSTPFGSYEEAVKEFKKIFRSKSGNSWDDINGPVGFNPIPKKYRLVHKDLRNRKKPSEVKVDFEAIEKASKTKASEISKATGDLIRDLSLVHRNPYSSIQGVEASPFGQLAVDSLAKGDEILKQIELLLKENEKLKQVHDHSKDEEQKQMEELVNLSEEYYSTVPVFGFNTEKLAPIFTSDDLRAKQEIINNYLHLEFATQLLLGAHFNCTKTTTIVNPFDYIYSCLESSIQGLSPQEDEAQLILQYMHNTKSESGKIEVKNIYRIERPEEGNRLEEFEDKAGVANRWLLWHGTKDVNLLSIISRGLQVAPIGAQLSGHFFGKGIYFADMFTKSHNYCQGTEGVKYMFLCEVSLGKVHPVNTNDYNNDDAPKGLPNGCHSAVTNDSHFEPDPATTIMWKGRTVPLGKSTDRVLKKDQYYGMSYNEYIVFNPDQVRLKYLVQFKDDDSMNSRGAPPRYRGRGRGGKVKGRATRAREFRPIV